MKIKKLFLGALAAATMATSIGVANTPVFAAEQNEAVAASINYNSISCITPFPDASLREETYFEHNGIMYTLGDTNNKYHAYPVNSPSEVRYLALYSHLFEKEVDYSELDLSFYSNVIKVIINANNPNTFYSYLTGLTKEFDLYLTGQFSFNQYVKDLNIRGLYHVCPYYGNSEVLESIEHLNGSKIDAVYSYRFGNNYWAYNSSTFEDAEITNVDGTVLTMQTIVDTKDLRFDLEDFMPYETYKTNVPYLGASGWNEVEDLTNGGLVQDKMDYFIRSVDSKVDTLYFDHDGFNSNNVMFDCKRLVLPYYDGQSFLNSEFEEIVLINDYDDYNFTNFQHAKTIRFVSPDETGGVVWRGFGKNVNYIQEIEKILIPEQFAESHYSMLVNDTDLGSKVELYDESTYTMPTRSSFLSTNGNIYEVEDQSLLLADLESDIAVMTAAGVTPTTDTPVDIQIGEYYESVKDVTTPDAGDNGSTDNGNDSNDEIVFEDESEWTTGVNTIGTLMYASDKSLEDVVRLASNFMVWEDGEIADPTEYDIICNIVGERLSITVKKDGQIKKSVNIYIEAVPAEYGEFIYVELFGTNHGVLLTDIDETRTTNINNLYDYVMANAINYDLFNDVEIEEYSFDEEHLDTVDSYYRHRIAQKYFQTSTMIVTQDHDSLMDTTNLDLTTTGIINPDDDVEDAETEYDVKYISAIYAPATMNAKTIPYLLEELLVTKDGQPVTDNISVSVTYNSVLPNNEDYSFRMYVRLPDDCRYEKEVNVKVLDGTSNVGYVVFEDGSIVAVYHINAEHTVETLTNQIDRFLSETLKMSNPNVVIPAETNLGSTKTYTGFTYGEDKELTVIHSGVASLNYSTADRPVDDTVFKEGYNAMTNIYFTDNYNVNDVVKAIGNKLLLKEGVQVDGEYRVESTVYKDTIAWTFYINDVKVYSCQASYHIISDSTAGNFIYADAFQFHTGIMLLEKGNENTFADVYNQVIKSCKYTIEEPTTDKTLDLSTEGQLIVREIHQLGDFNYYNFETTVYVVDFESEVEDSQTEIVTPTPNPGDSGNTGNQGGNTGDSGNTGEQPDDGKDETPDDGKLDEIKDKLDNWFEDFKAKVEENKALKAATIAFGCITGILLLYGIYVIFKKLFRWLGR